MNLEIKPQMEIFVFGRVDISNVNSNKNELYAERILLRPTKEMSDTVSGRLSFLVEVGRNTCRA